MSEIQANSPKKRDTSFDAFRGLAILCVVFAHTNGYGWGFRDEEGLLAGVNFWFSLGSRDFYILALPLFLFISGYFLGGATINSWADYRFFLRKRVSRIAIPYLFWSCFFIALNAARSHSLDPGKAFFDILLGQVEGPYFFIVMLLQFYVLAPLFIRFIQTAYGYGLCIAGHLMCLGALYYIRLYVWPEMDFNFAKLPFVVWLSFFPLGIYMRQRPERKDLIQLPLAAALTALFYLLSLGESFLFMQMDHLKMAMSDLKITTFLYANCVILLLLNLRHLAWPKSLILIGNYAFGIYFIHGIFLRNICDITLKVLPSLGQFQPAFQILTSTATVLVCLIIITITRKTIGAGRASKWFGF